MNYTFIKSPIGQLLLAGERGKLMHLAFQSGPKARGADTEWEREDGLFLDAQRQLDAYFAGSLQRFELALDPQGTEFQRSVWSALLTIPFGETVSYGELAQQIGKPKAVRAVGGANGANPIAIIQPCHRVIGSTGDLTGFGGGLDLKRTLLEHESNYTGLFAQR